MEEYNIKMKLYFEGKTQARSKMLLYCFPTTYPMLSEVKRLRGKTQLQYDLDQNKDNDQRKGYVKFRNRHNQILESLSSPS